MANRAMAAKVERAKAQVVEAAQREYTKPAYMGGKPEVPAYDVAMVKRVEVKTRARKTVYRAAPARTLVSTGMTSDMFAKGDRLIKRT